MTTTTATAASNGSTGTQTATGQPERITGMARVNETETYHAASIMNAAMSEAERLCDAVYRAVTDAYFKDVRNTADSDSRTAAETAGSDEIQAQAKEALNCLQAAERYMRRLLTDSEPPF
jgi:predicted DsbA family dithiol-disulfide isomerase